jgi:hypothetical protein
MTAQPGKTWNRSQVAHLIGYGGNTIIAACVTLFLIVGPELHFAAIAADDIVSLSPDRERALIPGAAFQECTHCPEMVVVPAGSFEMGSPTTGRDRAANEGRCITSQLQGPLPSLSSSRHSRSGMPVSLTAVASSMKRPMKDGAAGANR